MDVTVLCGGVESLNPNRLRSAFSVTRHLGDMHPGAVKILRCSIRVMNYKYVILSRWR